MKYWASVGSEFSNRMDAIAAVLAEGRDVRHSLVGHTSVSDESRAADEMRYAKAVLGTEDPALRVHRLAQIWSVVAADLMGGMAALLRAHEVIFSPMPLVRASIEHSVRVIWLLDTDKEVSPLKRFARGVLEELRSAEEACAAVSHLTSKTHAAFKTVREELNDLRERVVPAWFKDFNLTGETRDRHIEGERPISPTAVMLHFGARWGAGKLREWQGMYDALSGYTHPTLFALDFYSAVEGQAVLSTDVDTVERIVRGALVPYYQALRYLLAYNGWPSVELEKWKAHLMETFPGFILDEAHAGND